jgi:hypothetical protein
VVWNQRIVISNRWPWDQSQSSTIIETGSSLNKGGRDFRKLIVILHFMVLRGLFDFGHREVQLVPAFDCIWKDFQRASWGLSLRAKLPERVGSVQKNRGTARALSIKWNEVERINSWLWKRDASNTRWNPIKIEISKTCATASSLLSFRASIIMRGSESGAPLFAGFASELCCKKWYGCGEFEVSSALGSTAKHCTKVRTL